MKQLTHGFICILQNHSNGKISFLAIYSIFLILLYFIKYKFADNQLKRFFHHLTLPYVMDFPYGIYLFFSCRVAD